MEPLNFALRRASVIFSAKQLGSPVILKAPCASNKQTRFAFNTDDVDQLKQLLRELNDLVYDSLGLDQRDRALVHDLVHVRLELNDGKVGRPAVRRPKSSEMRTYARRLKLDLDSFLGDEIDKRNQVGIVYNEHSGMI